MALDRPYHALQVVLVQKKVLRVYSAQEPVIRAIIVLWAQRILHSDRAQQGDLSVFQEAQTYPIAQHAKHPSTAKKLPYLKDPARQARMATAQALSQVGALETVLQASSVLLRQINPNVVHKEHTV